MADYYDGYTEETKAKYEKIAPYLELAQKQGDAAYMEKPWEVRIVIRKPKDESKDKQ